MLHTTVTHWNHQNHDPDSHHDHHPRKLGELMTDKMVSSDPQKSIRFEHQQHNGWGHHAPNQKGWSVPMHHECDQEGD